MDCPANPGDQVMLLLTGQTETIDANHAGTNIVNEAHGR